MRVELRDPELVSSVRPRDLVSYLRAQGWRAIDEEAGRFSIWSPGADEDGKARVEVLVPLSREFRDYALRVGDALTVLSEAEQRSAAAVFTDVRHASSDVIRLRLVAPRTEGGEVPLNDGAGLVQGARDMLLAAACATVQPRPVFHTRKPAQAIAYVEQVRLGQTEKGSFVVTLVSDLPPVTQEVFDAEAFEPEEPFARRAAKTLHLGLGALLRASHAALTSADFAVFSDAVENGVSANLSSRARHDSRLPLLS
jgi:hypothetical protein